jgi:hypothetical protein
MNPKTKKIILITLDTAFILILIILFALAIAYDYLVTTYPLVFTYIYIQYIFLYMTLRIKHCTSLSTTLIYRFHLFNFLFSLFDAIMGYIEVIKSLNGEGLMVENSGYFILELSSLVSAHVVVSIYVCCPGATFTDEMLGRTSRSVIENNRILEEQRERLRQEPLLPFEELEIQTEQYHSGKSLREGTCSVCLDDFQEEELIKELPLCHHLFHAHCLKQWYEMSKVDTCPVCRSKFGVV